MPHRILLLHRMHLGSHVVRDLKVCEAHKRNRPRVEAIPTGEEGIGRYGLPLILSTPPDLGCGSASSAKCALV